MGFKIDNVQKPIEDVTELTILQDESDIVKNKLIFWIDMQVRAVYFK